MKTAVLIILASAGVLCAQGGRSYGPDHVWWDAGHGGVLPWDEDYDNPEGMATIVNSTGAIRTEGHPFFEALGSNGRACITCHQPSNAMGLSAAAVRERWSQTDGQDPLFAAVDGSNCPDLPQKEMASHSLLIQKGLFRISLPWPPKVAPDFRIEVVSDPTGCNTSPIYGLKSRNPSVSVYRRPRMAANLKYVSSGMRQVSFMADGREPSLETQAVSAATIHEQIAAPLTDEQLREIVHFEMQIFAAQGADVRGGMLNEANGPTTLGPQNLSTGMASSLGGEFGKSFDIWKTPKDAGDFQQRFRASVARGSDVFSKRQFRIRDAGTPGMATCATCHATEKARLVDIGTTNLPLAKAAADLPLFKITCDNTAAPHPFLGRVIYTQDPGRALISGKCADVGSIFIQQFRGLAARAPYFSNGSSMTLSDVVEFYNLRFDIHYTDQEKQDLVNFLKVL
jgi:hypothetical protein